MLYTFIFERPKQNLSYILKSRDLEVSRNLLHFFFELPVIYNCALKIEHVVAPIRCFQVGEGAINMYGTVYIAVIIWARLRSKKVHSKVSRKCVILWPLSNLKRLERNRLNICITQKHRHFQLSCFFQFLLLITRWYIFLSSLKSHFNDVWSL